MRLRYSISKLASMTYIRSALILFFISKLERRKNQKVHLAYTPEGRRESILLYLELLKMQIEGLSVRVCLGDSFFGIVIG